MSLRSKLLASSVLVILVFSVLYLALSYTATGMAFDRYDAYIRRQATDQLENVLVFYYQKSGQSWEGVQEYVQPLLPFKERFTRRPPLALLDVDDRPVAVWPKGSENRWRESYEGGGGVRMPLMEGDRQIGSLWLPPGHFMGVEGIRSRVSSLMVLTLLISVLISFAAAFLISYFLANRISRPLKGLSEAARQVGQRRFDLRLPVTTGDEIGLVVTAFNEMSGELQRSEQARRNLVADVAHELRTPLTVIQGQLESIQQGVLPATVETVLPIHDEVIRLNRLVNDLRQLTLAEAGKLPLNRTPTDIASAIRKIADNFQLEAEARGIGLRVEGQAGLLALSVDPDRFTQIVVNLLGNALNHTPPGKTVSLGAEAANFNAASGDLERWCGGFGRPGRDGSPAPRAFGAGEGRGAVVWVADQGPGIDSDHLPYIFDRFYRVDQSRDRGSGGVGLGLAIAREFVIAHGGWITACNLKEEGSLFTFYLPAMMD